MYKCTLCCVVLWGVCCVTSEKRERLVAEIPEELKALTDADKRDNREIVEAALWREFGGQRMAAIERRIEEQQRRVSMIESERNERERELGDAKEQLEALRQKRETVEGNEIAQRKQLFDKVRMVPKEPDHPIVQRAADELDMEPADVIAEAYDE